MDSKASPRFVRSAGLEVTNEVAERLRKDLSKSRPFPTGTIIAWRSIATSGIHYEYAAVFANGSWYTTIEKGNAHLRPVMTHDELMNYFSARGDHLADLRVATDFEGVTL